MLAAFSAASPLSGPQLPGPRPSSEQIIYQQGVSPSSSYTGATDTYISHRGDEPINYGNDQFLALYSGDQQAALLRFSLDGLSSGDQVDHAVLSFFVSDHPTGTVGLPLALYQVLHAWTEMDATWYNATPSDLWTLAGCNGPGSDRASTPSATTSVNAAGVWIDLDITSLVQAWVNNPDTNTGVVLKAGNVAPLLKEGVPESALQDGSQYLLRSADYAAAPDTRPRLTVSYTPAGAGSPTATPTVPYGSPTSVVYQQMVSPPDYSGTFDTYISDYGDRDANYGLESAMRLRSNDHRASLIRFDISDVPSYARVYTATLYLYVQSRTNVNSLPVSAHRLLRPWVDTEATWMIAATGDRWAFPGANGLTTDHAADAFATTILDTTGVWTSWDVTNLAQDWVASPSQNFGIILKAGSGPQVEYSLVAGHYLANTSLRPRLEMTLAVPLGPTPTPTATGIATKTLTPTATPSVVPTIAIFQYGQKPDSGYTGVSDTYVSHEGDLTTNYGLDPVVTVGANDDRAALLRFDVTSIPSWAIVQSAQLSLFTDSASTGYPLAVSAFQLLRPWFETEATWLQATSRQLWTVPGANGLGSDRGATASGSASVYTLGDWYNFDVTAMARAWVASPDDNFGLILDGMQGPQVSYDFFSSQYQVGPGASLLPRLTVAYTMPSGPSPTPTETRTPTVTPTPMFIY